jgi:FkbM family methyltransferase
VVHAALRRIGYRISRIPHSQEASQDGTGPAYEVQRNLISNPAPVILDVGAHIGDVAKSYRKLFPDARIHCFEPFPSSYEKLVNAVSGMESTSCHRIAVSDSDNSLVLNANASSATNSLLPVDEQATRFWGGGVLEAQGEVPIQSVTLDSFCDAQGLDRVDILKLDVQGGEYAALKGAGRLLAEQRISLVFMELILVPTYKGQRTFREYLELLEGHGYFLLDFYNPVRSNSRLLQVDLIFLSKRFA